MDRTSPRSTAVRVTDEKAEIGKCLKAGIKIEGAELEHRQSLVVKWEVTTWGTKNDAPAVPGVRR